MERPYFPGGYIPRHSQNTRTQDTSIFKTEPEITREDEEALDGSFEKIWKSPVLTRPNKNKDLNESENIGKHTASKILGILCATIIPNFAQLHVSRNLQAHWIPRSAFHMGSMDWQCGQLFATYSTTCGAKGRIDWDGTVRSDCYEH